MADPHAPLPFSPKSRNSSEEDRPRLQSSDSAPANKAEPEITETPRPIDIALSERDWKRLNRRELLKLAPLLAAGALFSARLQKPLLTQGLSFGDWASAAWFGPTRLAPTFAASAVVPFERFPYNGYDVLDPGVNLEHWTLQTGGKVQRPGQYTLQQIQGLPKITQNVRHVCVEGWDVIGSFGGVRISDFLRSIGADLRARYLLVECADDYYESIDMASVLHPQSLLCYEMYGKPLNRRHGAPLRLHIPTKLGYKQAKYLTSLQVTDVLAPDQRGYWEDQGYSWFAGMQGTAMSTTALKLKPRILRVAFRTGVVPVANEHPWAVRFCHWLNAIALFVLVGTGLQIFRAFPSFGPKIPQNTLLHVPSAFTLGGWLGGALQWHFTFMWIFAGSGLLYVGYQAASGHWRQVLFLPKDIKGVWPMARHYFFFGTKPELKEPYNPLQKLAYTSALLFGALSFLTGLVLYKPVQFGWLAWAFGGFHLTRVWHFVAMCLLLSFIPGHLIMVLLHGWDNFYSMLSGWKRSPEYLRQETR